MITGSGRRVILMCIFLLISVALDRAHQKHHMPYNQRTVCLRSMSVLRTLPGLIYTSTLVRISFKPGSGSSSRRCTCQSLKIGVDRLLVTGSRLGDTILRLISGENLNIFPTGARQHHEAIYLTLFTGRNHSQSFKSSREYNRASTGCLPPAPP